MLDVVKALLFVTLAIVIPVDVILGTSEGIEDWCAVTVWLIAIVALWTQPGRTR